MPEATLEVSSGCGCQNQWYHFGVGAPPTFVYFSGDWDVYWGYRVLTYGHVAWASFVLRVRDLFPGGLAVHLEVVAGLCRPAADTPGVVLRDVSFAFRCVWCILPRDVRTLTFCKLVGFPLNH